jgi:hypothetical protein
MIPYPAAMLGVPTTLGASYYAEAFPQRGPLSVIPGLLAALAIVYAIRHGHSTWRRGWANALPGASDLA